MFQQDSDFAGIVLKLWATDFTSGSMRSRMPETSPERAILSGFMLRCSAVKLRASSLETLPLRTGPRAGRRADLTALLVCHCYLEEYTYVWSPCSCLPHFKVSATQFIPWHLPDAVIEIQGNHCSTSIRGVQLLCQCAHCDHRDLNQAMGLNE